MQVADIPIDHPSCSKQHAVIQFRLMTEQMPVNALNNTPPKQVVKPFIIDLESTNGTFVNDERIPASRYYELRSRDTIRFGCSTREYVLLCEEDSDQKEESTKQDKETSA
jgi:smad nuclear-interacting protein 1